MANKRKMIITIKSGFPFIGFKIVKIDQTPKDGLNIDWVRWFWCGMFLLALGVIFEKFQNHFTGFQYIFIISSHVFRDLAIAIISASLIAKIIEVPNFIKFVNDRTIESLTNDNFLSSLEPQELIDIKKRCSKLIFEKKGKRSGDQFLNESLLEYESEISELVLQPYNEYYKVNIHCEDVTLDDDKGRPYKFIRKTTKRNFKIVNPLRGETQANIITPFNMHCPEGFKPESLVQLKKIMVTRDNSKEKLDVTEQFEPVFSSNGVTHPNYNTKGNYFIKPNKNSNYPFKSELIVEFEDIRYIAHSDPIYVQRISKPTMNFSINYSYHNPKKKLKIEGFGTNANLTDGKIIKTENGNSVSFDMLTWLLPGNGILIASILLEDNDNHKDPVEQGIKEHLNMVEEKLLKPEKDN